MEYTSLVYYVFMNFIARPNFAKTKRGASGGFLPRPLLLRLRHPNSEKRNQPKFWQILYPENCFRKTSSALFQISSSGLLSKKVRILYNEYRINKNCPTRCAGLILFMRRMRDSVTLVDFLVENLTPSTPPLATRVRCAHPRRPLRFFRISPSFAPTTQSGDSRHPLGSLRCVLNEVRMYFELNPDDQ